jgi:WS/DGAT/MGAT family acyltransferase
MESGNGHERLRALDEAFLHLERVDTPMHVGAVAILERAPFLDADGRFRLDDVRRLITSRMQLLPKFRQRVVPVPFGRGRAVWTDQAGFTVADHVHLTSLPEPGNRRSLFALAERLMDQLLDRDRPLWEMWFVDGVDGGEHVGLIHRSHHTLTDGVSGVDLAMAVLDFTPEPMVLDDDGWEAGPPPEPATLVSESVRRTLAFPRDAVSVARRLLDAPRDCASEAMRLGRSLASFAEGALVAPRLSINDGIGTGRSFQTVNVPLDTIRQVSRTFGCTVNDVVLAAVSSALGRLLDERGELHEELVVKAFCPVSVRVDEQRMELGNRISAMFVPLPVGDVDARSRLHAVRVSTESLKERGQADGAAAVLQLSELASPAMLGLAARAAHRQPLANVIVTNIPGPDAALYCLGARLLEVYPIAPLSQNLTVNVALLSYGGNVHFGLLGDGAATRDLERLAGGIEDALHEMHDLPEVRGLEVRGLEVRGLEVRGPEVAPTARV